MNIIPGDRTDPFQHAAPGTARMRRLLVMLGIAVFIGGVVVWQLRQEWARNQVWPWLALLIVMIAAAQALHRLKDLLPGQPILPKLASFHSGPVQKQGALALVMALLLTGLIIWWLWPDLQKWQGTPILWTAALLLVLAGAWRIGGVGRESVRAAATRYLWPASPRNRWVEAAVFALILALAIFLRTYRLDTIPPGIYVDETNSALDALYILEGRPDSPFGTGWYGTPSAYLYYMAAIFKLFGADWASLKMVSLIPAILSVPAVYLLGRLMFGPLVGLCAMLLMAVSRWHLSMSRWGWNETAPPLFQILATYFLIRGLRERRALDYALSGLLTGLSIYTYLSARLAAATLVLFLLYWFLSDPSGWRAALRRSWAGLAILATAALIAAAPLGLTFIKDPYSFSNRTAEISILRDIRAQGSLNPLVQNVIDLLKFFHQTGDHQGKHNLPDEPMADPITGLLFAVGLAYALIGWRDWRSALLLLWLIIGLAGSFLSSQHESPQSYRALSALPAVVLLAAGTLERLARALYLFLQSTRHPALPALAAGGLLLLALSGAAAWEANTYFSRQANSLDVLQGFNPTENGVAREVISAILAGDDVYLSPRFYEYSPLRFLLYGVMKAKTGENTLEKRPYQVILPEINLPVPDQGSDVLILLDSLYWPLRDYLASFYPGAQMELVSLPNGPPLYVRIRLNHSQVAALQGLTQTIEYADGRVEKRPVEQVEWAASGSQAATASHARRVTWEGAVRLEHGGEYTLRGEEGLRIFVDGALVQGTHYLGRGLYQLRVVWDSDLESAATVGAAIPGAARLTWQALGQSSPAAIPKEALFRVSGFQNGLLSAFWPNTDWAGPPTYQQVAPFLLLSWPDEPPIVPDGPFSARFTGLLRITEAGRYRFRIEADDGARLILDGKTLGEGLMVGQPNNIEAEVDLLPGQHAIQVDYFQQGGGSALRFYWAYDSAPLAPVPPSVLSPRAP